MSSRQYINEAELPDPAWLVRLTADIESAKSFILNGIVPFELIDRIRYYIDPTEEQQAQIRAERQGLSQSPSLLDRLTEFVHNEDKKRMAEVQEFARVLENFYTSLEAPGRLQTVYDESFSGEGKPMRRAHTYPGDNPKSGSSFTFRPEQIFGERYYSGVHHIIAMAGRADDILRGNYDVKARFAVWSPYGPGFAGLKRLFLIYDGVIEPHIAAKLDAINDAELVDALNIVTASAGGRAITADASAKVEVRRRTQETFASVVDQRQVSAWAPSFPGETQWDPVIISGVNSLLKIPVRDAYQAWYAAQWTQSVLNHEASVGPDILAAHCRMIEFRLGYNTGTQFRHIPTFYQITLERPIMAACESFCSLYQGATSSLSSTGASISQVGEWVCNLLGVSTERPIGVKARLSQQELDNLARLNAVARINVSARNSYDAIGPDARAALEGLARHSAFAINTGEQAAHDIVQSAHDIVQVAQTTIAAISADERMQRIAARMGEAGTAVAASGRQSGVFGKQMIESGTATARRQSVELGKQMVVSGTAAAKQFAARASAGVAGLVSTGDFSIARSMMQMVAQGIQIDPTIVASGPSIDINCRQIVGGGGGGSREEAVDSVMTVSPVVVVSSEIITLENAVAISAVNEKQVQEVVQGMLSRLEHQGETAVMDQGVGLGIYNKRKTKHRTKKYIKGRKGKKGCKGTKKGCKKGRGTKRRGTSHKSMPPTNTMRILKQKLKL